MIKARIRQSHIVTRTTTRLYFQPAGWLQWVGAAVGIIGSLKGGSDAKKSSRYDAESARIRSEGEADLILKQADFRNRILARQIGLSARRTLINRATAQRQISGVRDQARRYTRGFHLELEARGEEAGEALAQQDVQASASGFSVHSKAFSKRRKANQDRVQRMLERMGEDYAGAQTEASNRILQIQEQAYLRDVELKESIYGALDEIYFQTENAKQRAKLTLELGKRGANASLVQGNQAFTSGVLNAASTYVRYKASQT